MVLRDRRQRRGRGRNRRGREGGRRECRGRRLVGGLSGPLRGRHDRGHRRGARRLGRVVASEDRREEGDDGDADDDRQCQAEEARIHSATGRRHERRCYRRSPRDRGHRDQLTWRSRPSQ